MSPCRVDSDALFHQLGIRLDGVYDVQLADVAARRSNAQSVQLLSGMACYICSPRHWMPCNYRNEGSNCVG